MNSGKTKSEGHVRISGGVAVDLHPKVKADWAASESRASDLSRKSLIVAGATLGAVIIYAVLTGFLTYSASQQLNEARVATAAAMTNFRMSQRAWVLIDDMSFDGAIKPGQFTPFHLAIKNFGQSPALRTQTHNHTVLSGGSCDTIRGVQPPYKSVTVVAPGKTLYTADGALNLSPACIADLHTGLAQFQIDGYLEYDDIFESHHTTKYCWQFEGKTVGIFSACPTGNSAE